MLGPKQTSLHTARKSDSLLLTALWLSWMQTLFVSKPNVLGLISPMQVPRAGVLDVGHKPSLLREKLRICELSPDCGSPRLGWVFSETESSASAFRLDVALLSLS